MSSDEFLNINREIRSYAKGMNRWWKELQKESVSEWVILTTFGCWGIPNKYYQIIAFLLTILLFAGRLPKVGYKKSFSNYEKGISLKINKSLLSESQKERLRNNLVRVKKFRGVRATAFVLKRNWRFIAGYTFLMVSFLKVFLDFEV